MKQKKVLVIECSETEDLQEVINKWLIETAKTCDVIDIKYAVSGSFGYHFYSAMIIYTMRK